MSEEKDFELKEPVLDRPIKIRKRPPTKRTYDEIKCVDDFFYDETKYPKQPVKKKKLRQRKAVLMIPPLCHCIECFEYLGEMNPRQLCCKTYCPLQEDTDKKWVNQTKIQNLKLSPYSHMPEFKDYHEYIQKYIKDNS